MAKKQENFLSPEEEAKARALEIASEGKLNEVIHIEFRRPDGSLFIGQDFSNCPSMAEQHSAHVTDINYLMERYQPDELSAYITARNQHRQEIVGHDFSTEPNLQEAKNLVYQLTQAYKELPDDLRRHFKNHVEFLKHIDNPSNQQKLIKLGLITQEQIDRLTPPDPHLKTNDKPNDDKIKGSSSSDPKTVTDPKS